MINFNNPLFLKKNFKNFNSVVKNQSFSGNGEWTNKCQNLLKKKFNFKKVLLTDSCTSALEIAALSLDFKIGDEVIIPSYSYPTTASAFLRCGFTIRFVDNQKNLPFIDKNKLENIISKKTKAIVIVHQCGQLEDLDYFLKLKKKNIYIIEDAAQSIGLKYMNNYAGSFGDFGCYSFHETKNIHCGLGGALIINNKKFYKKSHYIWERGTNRVDIKKDFKKKYKWVEIGSNFYSSEFQSAFLYEQIKKINYVLKERKKLFLEYKKQFSQIDNKNIMTINFSKKSNYHMIYILVKQKNLRQKLIKYLMKYKIHSVSHYEPLHLSPVGKRSAVSCNICNAQDFSKRIIRLPIHLSLKIKQIKYIVQKISEFF